jgi:hypothetical protein
MYENDPTWIIREGPEERKPVVARPPPPPLGGMPPALPGGTTIPPLPPIARQIAIEPTPTVSGFGIGIGAPPALRALSDIEAAMNIANQQDEERIRAWERTRALDDLPVRSVARATNPDNGRIVGGRHESSPPRPRRTHGTPGSFSSPEITRNSRRLAMDLNEIVSTPTRNRRPVQDDADVYQTLAGAEDSFDNDPPVDRALPFSSHPKRNAEGWRNRHMKPRRTL